MRERLFRLLNQLDIPADSVGYLYVFEAIVMYIDEPKSLKNYTKNICLPLAERYNCTTASIERAMRRCVRLSCESRSIEFYRFFQSIGVSDFDNMPAKRFIALIGNYLMLIDNRATG